MPVKQGTFGTSPIYSGAYKIGKIYNGTYLVYKSGPVLPFVIAPVKRLDLSSVAQSIEGINPGNYFLVGFSGLATGEVITLEYGGVTKTYTGSTAPYYVTFGNVNGVDDGTPQSGWLTITSNTLNSTAKVNLMDIRTGSQSTNYGISCLNGDTIKGNYAFPEMLCPKWGGTNAKNFGYYPTQINFETTEIYKVNPIMNSGNYSTSNIEVTIKDIILGDKTSTIDDYAFGVSNGAVSLNSITFANRTNRKINIAPNAFKVKTASQYNVYIYDNTSALEYDWTSANSGAKVYNNGTLLQPLTAPTATLNGDNIVITPVSGATKYRVYWSTLSDTYDTFVKSTDSLTVPVSSLNGYANMTSGSATTIYVKAYGTGYLWSTSSSVSYTKP